jgi:hypothetical protein
VLLLWPDKQGGITVKNSKLILWLAMLPMILMAWTAASAQITPLADSYTNSADASTNYGAGILLEVDGASVISYIQFPLTSIPSGAKVSEATLKLYVNTVTTAGTFNVDYVNGAWLESSITYDTAPALGKTITSGVSITAADKNQFILINVTSAVQAWLNASEPNDGVALVANSTFNATFDSKENTTTSHPPELDIVYAGDDGTITGVTTAAGSGLTGGGTTGTVDLSLTNTCTKSQVLQWNGSAWACASAGAGTITGVTAGTGLTGGGAKGTVTLNLDTTKVPTLAANNLLTGNNTFSVSGATDAIDAYTSGPGKTALVGVQGAASGGSYGVWGQTYDPSGAGVAGANYSSSTTGLTAGVYGQASIGDGVYGTSNSSDGYGVAGAGSNAASGSGASGGTGMVASGGFGDPDSATYGGYGIYAFAGSGGAGGYDGVGGYFAGGGNFGLGNAPTGYGDGIDVYPGTGYAGQFFGYVDIVGNLSKSGGSFKIDHPLDPANKYLYHSFVESPDMKNIYDGVATLDANGEALIQMPNWFGTLNRDFRYQLTCIGGFAPVYIAEELANNQFKIGGGHAGMRISWQITGIRQDAWANAHRIPVEEDKDARLKGYYIHPELYGAPPEKQIEWARHPQTMKKMQERRQQMKEKQVPLNQFSVPPNAAFQKGGSK